jgi:hypothetical protein
MAVQVVGVPTMKFDPQCRSTNIGRGDTCRLVREELAEYSPFTPSYTAVTMCGPELTVVGLYVKEHMPEIRVQLPSGVWLLSRKNPTVPDGVDAVADTEVSKVVAWFTYITQGEHETRIDVAWGTMATVKVGLELPEWSLSPEYFAVRFHRPVDVEGPIILEQPIEPSLPVATEQEPTSVGPRKKLMLPPIGAGEASGLVSLTFPVHEICSPIWTMGAVQARAMEVVRSVTLRFDVADDGEWSVSPAYSADTFWGPAEPEAGVNVTAQEEWASVQVEGLNEPGWLLLNVIVPVGAIDPAPASLTVTLQVVGTPTGTDAREQLTADDACLLSTVSRKMPELAAWYASPE